MLGWRATKGPRVGLGVTPAWRIGEEPPTRVKSKILPAWRHAGPPPHPLPAAIRPAGETAIATRWFAHSVYGRIFPGVQGFLRIHPSPPTYRWRAKPIRKATVRWPISRDGPGRHPARQPRSHP